MRFFMCLMMFLAFSRAEAAGIETLATGGNGGWVNTARPLTVDDFKGRVILLDFWTYGCINCMHVIPDLDYLEKKFPQLLVIGVHSAKYKGEGLNERIRAAAERFGIHHPVMNDNNFAVWDSFGVHAWPTLILLDDKGAEISRYAGEGHRGDLEDDIAKALEKMPAVKAGSLVAAAQDSGVLSFPSHITHAANTPWGALFFVSDTSHNRIIGFDAARNIKVTIGSGEAALKDGDFKTAAFSHPRGMVVVGDTLYVADTDNHALRGVDLKAGTVKTLAGDGTRGRKIASPWDVEPMADGKTLAVAMAGTHQLYLYEMDGGDMDVLAGSGREDIDDDTAGDAKLAQPSGLSRQGDTLYFVDAETSSLRQLAGGEVKTLIGTGLFDFGFKDGAYPSAMLQHAQGLFVLGDKIYIADTYNDALRVYDLKTKTLSTLALTGEKLSEPGDVFVLDGKAYVTDTGHHRIVAVGLGDGAAQELKLSSQ